VDSRRAEAELYDNHFTTVQARDLRNGELVHIRTLLQRSDQVKQAFSPERWHLLKQDVKLFRERMGPAYAGVLVDHGFNPTPLWTTIGGSLARLVPAGSSTGILLLTLLDPLLVTALFILLGVTFGTEVALLSRRSSDFEAMTASLLLIYSGLNLGAYYYVILLLLIPACRESSAHLALIFGGEAVVYCLQLFESTDAILFTYRCLLVGYLLVLVHLEPLKAICSATEARRARGSIC
jgi:hypothetical protein